MIPKIVHFHWEGEPIPWLRMVGVYTFKRLNPDWDVFLWRTPDNIRARGGLMYCQQADWTWLEKVYQYGGFAMATDTVFVRPVPDEWLDGVFCCGTNAKIERNRRGKRIKAGDMFHHNYYGAVRGHEFIGHCVERCRNMQGKLQHQAMGVWLMDHILGHVYGNFENVEKLGPVTYMSQNAITPVGWWEPEKCWGETELEIPEDTVGVTWFGGHESSTKHSPTANSEHNYAIVKLARKVLGEAY